MAKEDRLAYQPLKASMESDDSSDDASFTETSYLQQSPWKQRRVQLAIIVPWLLVVLLTASNIITYLHRYPNAQILYSPAQHLVQYEVKKFHHGFNTDISTFQGPPTDERDAAWEGLYNFGMTAISHESARHLVNKTGQIPHYEERPDSYLVELDVFHQLHCLNNVRMYIHKEHYSDLNLTVPYDFSESHVDHCIDTIRQSLMCHADITPLVWQWSDEQGAMRMHGDVVHSCRNYDIIREWARDNQVKIDLDPYTRIEDDINGKII